MVAELRFALSPRAGDRGGGVSRRDRCLLVGDERIPGIMCRSRRDQGASFQDDRVRTTRLLGAAEVALARCRWNAARDRRIALGGKSEDFRRMGGSSLRRRLVQQGDDIRAARPAEPRPDHRRPGRPRGSEDRGAPERDAVEIHTAQHLARCRSKGAGEIERARRGGGRCRKPWRGPSSRLF